jgi:hypothetical protein
MKLTIGMACYDDFNGVYFTVMHLREMESPEFLKQCELIVVDNDPKTGGRVQQVVNSAVGDFAKVRYVPFDKVIGTAAPRQHIFDIAEGEYVVCMDSHILIQRFGLEALMGYYQWNPESIDIISGPLVYDDRKNISTHFEDVIRHGMWGVWGTDARGEDPLGKAFEIGAMGLGLFSCRKAAWQGFNPAMDGFGGEEWYIHDKFRIAGGKALCLPALRWIHRFNEGQPYPRTNIQKIRNHILAGTEILAHRPDILDRFRKHFVDGINEDGTQWPSDQARLGNICSIKQWDMMIADPLTPASVVAGDKTGCGSCGQSGRVEFEQMTSLEDLYNRVHKSNGDINEHMPALKALAAKVDHVTDFGMRHAASTCAMLMGQPKTLISYAKAQYPEAPGLMKHKGNTDFKFKFGDSLTVEPHETDMLFIDTVHTYARLKQELERWAPYVKRYIVRHDTVVFGHRGEDGGPGLIRAIAEFVRTSNDGWTVVQHNRNNNGLMILSRSSEDRPKAPNLLVRGMNLAAAMTKWTMAGMPRTEEALYERRLDTCAVCPLLVMAKDPMTGSEELTCSECGCPVHRKASVATDYCPHPEGDKWVDL